jgi:glycosyltransferase involved in cell wall biosynthesis
VSDVAVVVPTHARPHLLRQTLRSVLAQREVRLSVVVVDDGSPDPTTVPAVVAELADERLTVTRNATALGVSAARNIGIGASKSTWVAFCDDDDLWAPDKLPRQLAAAQADGAHWVYGGLVMIDSAGAVTGGEPPLPPRQLLAELERWNPVPAGSSNVVVRRETIEAERGFDPELQSGGDWDLFIRLGHRGTPAWVRAPLVAYRVHGAAMTQNRRRMLADLEIINRRYGGHADVPRHLRWAAWDAAQAGQRSEALRLYARAVAAGDPGALFRALVSLAPPELVDRIQRRRAGTEPDLAYLDEARRWLMGIG